MCGCSCRESWPAQMYVVLASLTVFVDDSCLPVPSDTIPKHCVIWSHLIEVYAKA